MQNAPFSEKCVFATKGIRSAGNKEIMKRWQVLWMAGSAAAVSALGIPRGAGAIGS